MSISAHFKQISSRHEDRHTKTRINHSLTRRKEEIIVKIY